MHGIHCRPRAETLYTVHAMHADVLTRAHFVLLLEFVLYILYTFYAPISVSLIDRSLLRLTNRTSSCYKLQIIDIVPFCTIVLYTFTILQYGISIFHRFIVIYHLTIENSLIWQSIFITSIIRKFPPDIRFCITDELINIASYFRPAFQI